jgi:hypothetical protein
VDSVRDCSILGEKGHFIKSAAAKIPKISIVQPKHAVFQLNFRLDSAGIRGKPGLFTGIFALFRASISWKCNLLLRV